MKGTGRKLDRIPKCCTVSISWEASLGGAPMFARAKTVDISTTGMQIELPTQIPVNAAVNVRCDELRISGRGMVRHCTRKGPRFRVGVEFTMPIRLPLEA
ncbi:MAG: PilZ domain-containing protein [Bryobacteraceae bacterium]|nr:PilZ domain-containing protein [Bryobacteraceae bacterium]